VNGDDVHLIDGRFELAYVVDLHADDVDLSRSLGGLDNGDFVAAVKMRNFDFRACYY